MSERTAVERLNDAADLIERMAADAAPFGRGWVCCPEPDNDLLAQVRPKGSPEARILTDPILERTAAWIALLGPDKAPHLAAWLRGDASAWELSERHNGPMPPGFYPPALAFADSILGGTDA